MINWRKKAKPVYLDWDSFGVFAVAGKSRSGKSSTTRFLLAQMAMGDVGLIIADGHGKFGGHNLAATIQPLEKAFIRPVAIELEDIIESIRFVMELVDMRLNSGKKPQELPKVALVIDEVASVMLRIDPQQGKDITHFFQRLANEAGKTNVRVFLLSQNWSADFIGAASVRRSIGGKLLHRLDEGETTLFFPSAPAQLKRTISGLKQGEAVFESQTQDPVKVTIPYITLDDLTTIRDFVVVPSFLKTDPFLETLLVSNERMTNDHENGIQNAEEHVEPLEVHVEENVPLTHAVQAVQSCIEKGWGKEKTLIKIFHVTKGGSKKYKAASKLYDALKQRMEQETYESW